MLHSADEVAQVRCGIHRDKPPDALVIFEDVDAGIVLLDLPEAADAHAEEVADDDLIYCIVRCDEDGFPVILFCIFVKSSADTFPDIFQAFAFRHLYFFRMGMPEIEGFRIPGFDLIGMDAFPKTVTDFYFNPMRLLGMQSRQSAAYKGVMALILKNHAKDFISGMEMDFSTFSNEKIDIHHIFPRDYCTKNGYDKLKWNSVVNKTPLSARSNREIGGNAPSAYLKRLEKKGSVSSADLDKYVESHWIDHNLLRADDFQNFIIDRAKKLLAAIEKATGRTISGKDSDEVKQAFGAALN